MERGWSALLLPVFGISGFPWNADTEDEGQALGTGSLRQRGRPACWGRPGVGRRAGPQALCGKKSVERKHAEWQGE